MYAHFAARDRLSNVMFERMLAGVSTRRDARTAEPVGEEIDEVARSTSKSAVSRAFVSRTRENLIELIDRADLIELVSRPLDDMRLAVLMLDGIELEGRCCIIALGIDVEGVKHPLELWAARRRTPPSRPRCSRTSWSAARTQGRARLW